MARETVDADYVKKAIGMMPILDVRPKEMYEEGHIPTAKNVDYIANEAEGGPWSERFTEKVAALGLHPGDEFVVYCLTGEHAGLDCNLLEQAGYERLRYYQGSWLDWIQDRERPVESA